MKLQDIQARLVNQTLSLTTPAGIDDVLVTEVTATEIAYRPKAGENEQTTLAYNSRTVVEGDGKLILGESLFFDLPEKKEEEPEVLSPSTPSVRRAAKPSYAVSDMAPCAIRFFVNDSNDAFCSDSWECEQPGLLKRKVLKFTQKTFFEMKTLMEAEGIYDAKRSFVPQLFALSKGHAYVNGQKRSVPVDLRIKAQEAVENGVEVEAADNFATRLLAEVIAPYKRTEDGQRHLYIRKITTCGLEVKGKQATFFTSPQDFKKIIWGQENIGKVENNLLFTDLTEEEQALLTMEMSEELELPTFTHEGVAARRIIPTAAFVDLTEKWQVVPKRELDNKRLGRHLLRPKAYGKVYGK